MKTLLCLFASLLTFWTFSQPGNSGELAELGLKKFPIEKGKIEYLISGNATGKATLYFDRYGWRSSLVTEMSLKQFGVESYEHTLEIWDGDYFAKVDLIMKKGTKKKDDRWSQLARYKEASEIPGIFYSNDGGTYVGAEILLERETSKWTFVKGIVQAVNDWNGIALRTSKKLPGLVYEVVATSITEDTPDPSFFDLPDSISWE